MQQAYVCFFGDHEERDDQDDKLTSSYLFSHGCGVWIRAHSDLRLRSKTRERESTDTKSVIGSAATRRKGKEGKFNKA